MASLVPKVASLRVLTRTSLPRVASVRLYADFRNDDDWKPGPWPKTAEERAAAARKYGMLPEDYKPYPSEGDGYGDYPMLDIVSAEDRDPFEHYDMRYLRRNLGEPLHVNADMYGMDKVKHRHDKKYTATQMYAAVLSFVAFFWIVGLNTEDTYSHCFKPKEFPFDGEKHYTFEKP